MAEPHGFDEHEAASGGVDTTPVPGTERPADSGERGWAAAAHLTGIVFNVLGPLVVHAVGGRESAFVRDQAREAINFQLTVLGGVLVSLILFAVFVGPVLLAAVAVVALVLPVAAAIRAGQGAVWRYPLATRLVR